MKGALEKTLLRNKDTKNTNMNQKKTTTLFPNLWT